MDVTGFISMGSESVLPLLRNTMLRFVELGLSKTKHIFLHCDELEEYCYPEACPFNIARAGKVRKTLASMGILSGSDRSMVAPAAADEDVLLKYHETIYLDVLQAAAGGGFEVDMLNYGLGTGDCPVFKGMYDYARLAVGATVTGAKHIIEGDTQIAFNPSGGYHHAFEARAAGFCYLNDVALGCMVLAEAGMKVLYLDVDVHHGDGVQHAFYNRKDVMTISTHQTGKTLFPGTGHVDEIGAGDGVGYSVNVPLWPGTYDLAYMRAFREAVLPVAKAFEPDVIVMEIGADGLAGDPLAGLQLTNKVYVDVIDAMRAFNKPILAVGGGGYNVENTVRAWSLCWAALCDDLTGEENIGMGGVMMESTDWLGGLKDRKLVVSEEQIETIEPAIDEVIEAIKKTIFPIHGI